MRIVLDTNVLIRSAVSLNGPAHELVKVILGSHDDVLILSEPLISEVRNVLARPFFRDRCGVTTRDAERFCRAIEQQADMVAPAAEPCDVQDADDD
jgi:predicted nucleic acid-binding protein